MGTDIGVPEFFGRGPEIQQIFESADHGDDAKQQLPHKRNLL
jgi:hypothetical protein